MIIGDDNSGFVDNPAGTGTLLGKRAIEEVVGEHLGGDSNY